MGAFMPIYEFKCTDCGHEFEEIIPYDQRDVIRSCKICGKDSQRKVASLFGVHTSLNPRLDTIVTNKEIDKVVGKESDRRWSSYDERWKSRYEARQQVRRKGKTPEVLNIPKDSDGKYSPIMHLGDNKERSLRKEYSEALQEHRADRKKRGLQQFDSSGSISQE
jgi:putative FmdB family regulatory protein